MGRFDALTQLDKKPLKPTPPPDVPAVADPQAPDPLPENEIVRLLAKKQTSKTLKKFGSYLTEESLKDLKRIAFETDRKDYDVLQEAVDQYLERNKTG